MRRLRILVLMRPDLVPPESKDGYTARQINEWILGDLLEGASVHPERAGEIFGAPVEREDGLVISAAPRNVIELPLQSETVPVQVRHAPDRMELDWLSQPVSGQSLAWTVDVLVVVAAFLLFTVVFLSVTRETPRWPVSMAAGAAMAVAGLYWGFFKAFGGGSPGRRLARLAEADAAEKEEAKGARFR